MGRWTDSRGNQAFVHYRAAPLAPNYETTITWLHDMRDESNVQLENGCVLLLDHAGWHKKAEVQQEFEDAEIQVLLYPKRAGKWLDPQDQAFHREMRRAYVKLLTSRDGSKVGKIVEAYYAVSDQAVEGSWAHTGMLRDNYEQVLTAVAAEGFRAGKGKEDLFSRGTAAWEAWILKNFGARGKTLPDHRLPHAPAGPQAGRAHRGWKK